MFGVAALVGLVNGLLIRFANFTAIAATLAMFIGLQGVSVPVPRRARRLHHL